MGYETSRLEASGKWIEYKNFLFSAAGKTFQYGSQVASYGGNARL